MRLYEGRRITQKGRRGVVLTHRKRARKVAAWRHDSMGKERGKKEGVVGFKVEGSGRRMVALINRNQEGIDREETAVEEQGLKTMTSSCIIIFFSFSLVSVFFNNF